LTEEWMSDPERTRAVRINLRHRASDLRSTAKRLREAFRQDFMRAPSRWTADVYDRAAEVLETALAEIPDAK
jgi:hypothetical protein